MLLLKILVTLMPFHDYGGNGILRERTKSLLTMILSAPLIPSPRESPLGDEAGVSRFNS